MPVTDNAPIFTENSPQYTERYKAVWEDLQPELKGLLKRAIDLVEAQTGVRPVSSGPEPIVQGGDEEFKLSVDWPITGSSDVVGMDVVMTDALARGEEEGAFGLLVEFMRGARTIGTFAPYNYSDDAFTLDVDELKSRINDLEDNVYVFVKTLSDELATPAVSRPTP